MSSKRKKSLKKLAYAGIIILVLAGRAKQAKSDTAFENIPVTTAEGDQTYPAIWGNYIVWKGAENEAYDIEQRKIVEMPGLIIDGIPAIWDNKVVWSGANGYYDIDSQQMVYPAGLSVGDWPAIHSNKIVWSNSSGYYDLESKEMVYPHGLSIGDHPDIFEGKIIWSGSKGYYDIGLQQMVYPEGAAIGRDPAIYANKVVWTHLVGGYYDIESQTYFEGGSAIGCRPDIFEETIVWHSYDAVPPIVIDVGVWDPVCGKRRVTDSGCAYYPKIYGDVVVWMDARNGSADIYMTPMLACCGDPEHPYPLGDLNKDCRVDLLDLAILASHWLECTQPVSD